MFETIINLKSKDSHFKMILRIPGLIENAIYVRRGWETGLAEKMASFIKDNSIFIDIGSNIGYHTLYIASCLLNVKCIGFEPNPTVLADFKRNVEINNFTNISLYDYAIGEACGMTDFYMTGENSVNRGLSAVNLPKYGDELLKTTVKLISLDEFLDPDSKSTVSVLKIDAQGYEYQVINGALDVINKSHPVIFLEYHDESEKTPQEIFSLIPDYRIYIIDAWTGEVKEYEKSASKCCSDFLCIPSSATLPI